jgi:hypothetical protein
MNSAQRAVEAGLFTAEKFQLLQPLHNATVMLRLWACPTFSDWMSWTVITTTHQLLLRRLSYKPTQLVGSEGVLTGAEVNLQVERWKTIERGLRAIHIKPSEIADGVGLDGTWYGMAYERSMGGIQMEWWETEPRTWNELAKWWQETAGEFQKVLPTQVLRNRR